MALETIQNFNIKLKIQHYVLKDNTKMFMSNMLCLKLGSYYVCSLMFSTMNGDLII